MNGGSPGGDALALGAAARRVGVSPVTLRRWADAGRVEYFRTPGGQRRFRLVELERIRNGGDEQARMFAALREASRAITSAVASDEILEVVARSCGTALGTTDCVIFAYDPAADTLQGVAFYEVRPTDYAVAAHEVFPVDGYPGGRELLEHGGYLEEHLSDPDLDPQTRADMIDFNERSCLSVAIRYGDEPLGLMVLTEAEYERRFSKAERELAVALAEQAAIGLHTARMLHQREERTEQLATLLESSRAVATATRLEDALSIVARRTCEMLGSPEIIIYEYLREQDAIVARAFYEVVPSGWNRIGELLPLDDWPLDRRLLQEGRMLVEHLSDPDLDPATRASMEQWGTTTSLAMPARFGDESVGIIFVFEVGEERIYTPEEIAVVKGLAEQAAVAIHDTRLHGTLQEQNRRLASLLEVSRATTSTLDLDDVLERVVHATIDVLGVESCIIWEYDTDAETLVERCAADVDSDYKATGMVWSLSERVVERQILFGDVPVVETISDPDLHPLSRESMDEYGEKTCLSVPLRAGSTRHGLLVLTTTRAERRFTDAELELARGLAEQAALAIENAKLFGNAREIGEGLARHADRLRMITDSAFEFSSSLDLRTVLRSVARRLMTALAVTSCEIFMLSASREFTCVASLEGDRVLEEFEGATYKLEDWTLTASVVDDRVTVTVSDRDDPRLKPPDREVMETFGEAAKMMVPLVAGDSVIGVVELVEQHRRREFTADEVATVEAVARMAALAIENARLFEAREERTRSLVSLLDAGRALTSTFDIDEVLSVVAETTVDAIGSDECVIFEHDAGTDTITARSFFSRGPSDYDELGEVLSLDDYPEDRHILEQGEITVESVSDPDVAAESRQSMERFGEKTCMSVPLRYGEETVGLLVLVETREERVYTTREIELARGLGEQAAAAIHNARVFSRLRLRTRETELLNEIARKATASLNVVDVGRATTGELKRLMEFDRATLTLADDDGVLRAVFSGDEGPGLLDGTSLEALTAALGSELRDRGVASGDPTSPGSPLASLCSPDGLRSVALVGLTRDDALTGVLALGSARETAFATSDLDFLEGLGAHLSLAVNNAAMFENIRLMHLGNLRTLSSALNAKDYYTLGHTARVAAYAVLLATKLGWRQELVDQVEEIAYLHDIGKIAVSDRSLLKPGPLSEEEWALMREHPVISAEIIQPLLGEHLVAGVRHHHEFYDGSGYPDGLSGEGISPMARLLCVVDSYDAMSSLRLYRQALTYRECLRELDNGKGIQFDPDMVDAFVEVLGELHDLKGTALVAAWEAAVDIDAEVHTALAEAGDGDGAGLAGTAAVLESSLREHDVLSSLSTEVRIDEHRSMIVVARSDDERRAARAGEILLADQEQMEAYAGRPLDTNVLSVDEHGAWVCGLAPICADDGRIVGLVRAEVSATDISGPLGATSSVRQTFAGLARDAASRLMRVEIDSMIDGLSGLYNHRYLHERLSEEVARANAQETGLAMLFCDVDHFKEINDRFGHRIGDDVLRRIAQLIAKAIRRVDLAARYGGDEFAVVLLESDAQQALEVAERIRGMVSSLALLPGGETPTVSIGIATLPGDATTKTELVDKADWAMYLAKRRGRDRCARFSDG